MRQRSVFSQFVQDVLIDGGVFLVRVLPEAMGRVVEVMATFGLDFDDAYLMLRTYQAILRGEVVEWLADKPDNLTSDRAVAVYVTIQEEAPPLMMTERGLRMAAALEQLAQMQGAIASIEPLHWERELRQERELPGRESDVD